MAQLIGETPPGPLTPPPPHPLLQILSSGWKALREPRDIHKGV